MQTKEIQAKDFKGQIISYLIAGVTKMPDGLDSRVEGTWQHYALLLAKNFAVGALTPFTIISRQTGHPADAADKLSERWSSETFKGLYGKSDELRALEMVTGYAGVGVGTSIIYGMPAIIGYLYSTFITSPLFRG